MKTYRIVLEFTTDRNGASSPDEWNWHHMLGIQDDYLALVSVDEIPTDPKVVAEMTLWTEEE